MRALCLFSFFSQCGFLFKHSFISMDLWTVIFFVLFTVQNITDKNGKLDYNFERMNKATRVFSQFGVFKFTSMGVL